MSTTDTKEAKTKARARPKMPKRQREVLDAAANLAKPGEPVSGVEIATAMGIQASNVYSVIRTLKGKGLWPYASFKGFTTESPKASALERETEAIRVICLKLAGLPDDASRKRVMTYCASSGSARD